MIFTLLLSGISSLLMIYFASKGEWSRSYFGTDSHSASLFLGAFLAILLEKIGIENFRRKLSYSAPFIIMGILYLIIYFVVLICWSLKGEYENKITFFFAIPIAAMATTIALFFILNMQVFLKSLPHSVFAIISKRSYEIYLIHVPVSTLVLMSNIKSNFSVIISFIITIVFSEIIYRLVEIPFSITYFRKKMLKNKAYITSLIMVFIITFSISIYNIITAPYISKTEKNMQENTYKMNEKIMDKLDEPVK
jgi:peptidoglycan/LPS O-acetylase OafA/YrhL